MKALPLFVLCAFALARAAFGQAFGESIQLSQPAVHKHRRGRSVPRQPAEFALRPAAAERRAGGQRHVSGTARLPLRPVANVSAQPAGDSRRHAGHPFQPQSQCGDLLHHRWLDADGIVDAIPRSYRDQRADAHPGIPKEPGKAPSPIVAATYTISGAAMPLPVNADVSGSTVTKGTLLRMQTGNRVSSETANAGRPFLPAARSESRGQRKCRRSPRHVGRSHYHLGPTCRAERKIRRHRLSPDGPQRAWSHHSAERIVHAGRARYRFAIESHLGHQHGARCRPSASRQ